VDGDASEALLSQRRYIAFIINIRTKVTDIADRKLRGVLSKICSKTAKQMMKAIMGSKNAIITFTTTEGPLLCPDCW